MGPYATAEYNPTYLLVDSEVQLSTPSTTNADESFPSHSKVEHPIGNGENEDREGNGWEPTLCLRKDILWRISTPNS
jgi:hypothetical protein